ncbi:MAG: DoxX family protein [Colwellia sp.]|nr:DoxX family protein [Colwellia sp.]
MNFLSKYSDSIYAVMRIVAGAMFSVHGMQKIFGWLAQHETELLSQMWFGGMIELICGLLLVIGFQTRIAAFLSSGTMAVAYIQFHWAFAFGPKFFPAVNNGDAAILYSLLFLYIASVGAGKWSIDKDNS